MMPVIKLKNEQSVSMKDGPTVTLMRAERGQATVFVQSDSDIDLVDPKHGITKTWRFRPLDAGGKQVVD
jgi:hypothetical protein